MIVTLPGDTRITSFRLDYVYAGQLLSALTETVPPLVYDRIDGFFVGEITISPYDSLIEREEIGRIHATLLSLRFQENILRMPILRSALPQEHFTGAQIVRVEDLNFWRDGKTPIANKLVLWTPKDDTVDLPRLARITAVNKSSDALSSFTLVPDLFQGGKYTLGFADYCYMRLTEDLDIVGKNPDILSERVIPLEEAWKR